MTSTEDIFAGDPNGLISAVGVPKGAWRGRLDPEGTDALRCVYKR
jgi:hypothetical protein